jgi:hypothetical protein
VPGVSEALSGLHFGLHKVPTVPRQGQSTARPLRAVPGTCQALPAEVARPKIGSRSDPSQPEDVVTQAAAPRPSSGRRRVHSQVALALLETLRSQDFPAEILQDENVTLTLPRRFGLSDVIEAQIRRYRADARRRRRVPEEDILDLMRLVVRRPDSEDVFMEVGRALYPRPSERLRRFLPRRVALSLARSRAQRELRRLFGRRFLHAGGKGFVVDGAHDLLIRSDPGGDACALVTGFLEQILREYVGPGGAVLHVACIARRDQRCRWEFQEAVATTAVR